MAFRWWVDDSPFVRCLLVWLLKYTAHLDEYENSDDTTRSSSPVEYMRLLGGVSVYAINSVIHVIVRMYELVHLVMRGSRKFCQMRSNFDNVFLFLFLMRGEIPLQASHHQPTSETSFKWRFAGVPMMAQQ